MRYLVSVLALYAALTSSAMAIGGNPGILPEPDSIALFGIGALVLIALRKK
jgi:hypothetical protein